MYLFGAELQGIQRTLYSHNQLRHAYNYRQILTHTTSYEEGKFTEIVASITIVVSPEHTQQVYISQGVIDTHARGQSRERWLK